MGWGPKAPDMSGANEAARAQAGIAREQWDDFKTRFAPVIFDQMQQQLDVSKGTHALAREQQDFNIGLARRYNDRYWNTQVPLEDSIIQDARNFNTEDERNRMAGLARGDVAQSFAAGRGLMMREMGRSGMDPNDAGTKLALGRMVTDEALASVTAMNKTREAARQLGWSRMIDASALAKGMPGFTSSASTGAINWGAQGMQASSMGMNAATAGAGAQGQAAQIAGNNFRGAAQTYNDIYTQKMKARAMEQELFGTIFGAATSMATGGFGG